MTVVTILLFLILGAAGGGVHFQAIAGDAKLLVRGGSVLPVVALRLGRLLLTLAIFLLAARQGWFDLLTATIGFVAARHYVIGRLGLAS